MNRIHFHNEYERTTDRGDRDDFGYERVDIRSADYYVYFDDEGTIHGFGTIDGRGGYYPGQVHFFGKVNQKIYEDNERLSEEPPLIGWRTRERAREMAQKAINEFLESKKKK